MATYSDRIKELRIEANLSLRQLSKITKISPSAIHSYETGVREPGYKSLASLSKVFNCSIEYLLGKTDQKTDKKSAFKLGTRIDNALAKNIQSYRNEANISTKEMAELLGVDEETVLCIERAEYKLDKEMIFKICDVLHITPDFLDGMIAERIEDGDIDAEYCYTRFTDHVRAQIRPITSRRLPLLGNVACGEPIFAEESRDTYIDVDSDIDADFCLTAKGDSMINARIFDGDILFVKTQPIVDNGEIAVVLIEDEATVKRVYYDRENNIITLVPENPMYKPMRYVGEQLNNIRILGKVVFGQYNL